MTESELEQLAMRGAELPDGLSQPDQFLFQSFRALYRDFKSGTIGRDQAHREKAELLKSFRVARLNWQIWDETAKMRVGISGLLTEADNNGCEICRKIAKYFDGRMRF